MSDKVIVMEIKDNYAICMKEGGEVIRIKKKPNLSVGDKIYVLPEDIYKEEKANGFVPLPLIKNNSKRIKINPNTVRRVASMVAVFILCFSFLMLPQFTRTAYAMASFDGEKNVQMELDRNNRILDIESVDNSISKDELKKFKGKNINQLDSEFNELLGSGKILIGYAPEKDNWNQEDFIKYINDLFGSENVVFLTGNVDDIDASGDNDISIGKYIAGKMYLDDELDDVLEELDYQELVKMLREDPTWLEIPDFKEAIEDRHEDLFDDEDDDKDDIDDKDDDRLDKDDKSDDKIDKDDNDDIDDKDDDDNRDDDNDVDDDKDDD